MTDVFQLPEMPTGKTAGTLRPPEIVFFRGPNFTEEQLRLNLDVLYFAQESFWNDTISSIIVISGIWRVFNDARFQGGHKDLVPGYYADGTAFGIGDGTLSSAKVVAW